MLFSLKEFVAASLSEDFDAPDDLSWDIAEILVGDINFVYRGGQIESDDILMLAYVDYMRKNFYEDTRD